MLVVDGLSREKNVEKQIVFSALEIIISSATKKKLNDHEIDIEVAIDRNSEVLKLPGDGLSLKIVLKILKILTKSFKLFFQKQKN